MSYEFKATDVYGFASTKGTRTKEKGDELFFEYCPYCNGAGHDKETFSVNLKSGAFKCFRSSCDKHGHFVELARDFGYTLDYGTEKKPRNYKSYKMQGITVRDEAVSYLESRGISKAVTEKYNITVKKNQQNVLMFPFIDENGVIRFIKYRKTDFDRAKDKNKEWSEPDMQPILFGIAQCNGFDRLVITEGQIDSLSLAECGVANAVSVPTGALGMTWIENSYDWLCKFKEILVFGDCENGKITLVEEINKRIPVPVSVVKATDYLGEKDANDILRKYGRQAILTAIENAQPVLMPNVIRLADVQTVDIYNSPHILTNITELDSTIGGLFFGSVYLLSGKRGEGKSTFMSQIIAEALEQGCRTFAYSGELTNYHFKNWLDMQLAGPKHIKEYVANSGITAYKPDESAVSKINDWYRDSAYIYDNSVITEEETDDLLAIISRAICKYGIRLVCIDNLMTAIESNTNSDLYIKQSQFVKGLKQIAVRYEVAVILVAHPRKTNTDFGNDDVSGSADITNRVDVVLNYQKNANYDPENSSNSHNSVLSVTKNRLTGKLLVKDSAVKLVYSEKSKRICSINNRAIRSYGWDKMSTDGEPFEEDDICF